MKSEKDSERPEASRLAGKALRVRINSAVRKLPVPTAYGFHYICVDHIMYCEADTSYTRIRLEGNLEIVASQNIREYEFLLAAFDFFRVHKSYLINLRHVSQYHREDGGFVMMSNGAQIIIATRKKADFLKLFFRR